LVSDWSDEESDNPLLAHERDFSKVEKWTKEGAKVDRLLYAANNLERRTICRRPRIRLTIGRIKREIISVIHVRERF
jgi:hypothetical protein